MKLLRTIRLDPSDTFVFERAAAPGEWAVPGGFEFADIEASTLTGRTRQAFRAGFLGLDSLGWSTLVVAQPVTTSERDAAIERLAHHLVERHGAPTREAARQAAESEIAYAMSLAEHPDGTLIALHRTIGDDGSIREQFRTLYAADAKAAAAMPCSAGAFAIVDDDGTPDAPEAPTGAAEEVDLLGLLERGQRPVR